MKIQYSDNIRLGPANMERLEIINSIIDQYLQGGYTMTLRQLYYQLVSREVIPNNQKEYKKLSELLTRGRMAGVVDWSGIEDRGRQPRLPYAVNDIPDALEDTHDLYRLNRMESQENYLEVWVEKDALSNVFRRVTEKYHIRLMVNKGYSSSSAMHESFLRFKMYADRKATLLYFGDHDPSGKDMVRDIEARMVEFGLRDWIDFDVLNPALNMDQVRRYSLPENPAKITDPRAAEYIREYGNKSWELDALDPPVLVKIIETSVLKLIDKKLYDNQLKQEILDKVKILKIKTDFEDNNL